MNNAIHKALPHLYRLALLVVILSAVATQSLAQESKPQAKTDKSSRDNSHFTELGDTRIHYVDYGKGDQALVLIHGWTQNIDSWRDQIPELAKRNRVLALDLPGHGKSDKPKLTYNMNLFAGAVDAVMRDAKVNRAVLVGHSMGTPVARQFYRKYPDKTIAIVVVDGGLAPFTNQEMIDQMLAGLRGPKYRETVAQMFTMMAGGVSEEGKVRINTSSQNTPQHVLVSAMEGMLDKSIWQDDMINVPVLAIMAKNPFFPPNPEETYQKLVPNLDFHMWDNVGHFLHMEQPKQFNEAVLAYLDRKKLLVAD